MTPVYIILLFNIYHVIALNTSSSIITCDPTDDCQIICTQPDICSHKTFICPTHDGKKCNIQCIGSDSCLNTTFDASNSNNIQLTLSLDNNGDNDQNVWSYGSLLCPSNGDCSIISNDNIQYNHINAIYSNSLNITVFATDSNINILSNSDIYCPINDYIYCDINIYHGSLSNANIYSIDPDYLWIVCKTDKNCYNTQQQPLLHCGIQYISQCNIYSEDTKSSCDCHDSSNNKEISLTTDPLTTSIQEMNQTTINNDIIPINSNLDQNGNVIEHEPENKTFWETNKNLRYIIMILSSIIILSICTLCCFGFCVKIKLRSLELEQDIENGTESKLSGVKSPSSMTRDSTKSKTKSTTKSYSKSKYNKHGNNKRNKLSLKKCKHNNSDSQAATSLVSPNSMRSGVSSLQFTVNNIFGKSKGGHINTTPRNVIPLKQIPISRPIPPIPPPSMQVQSKIVTGFRKPWMNFSQYFMNGNGTIPAYSSDAMTSYHDGISQQQDSSLNDVQNRNIVIIPPPPPPPPGLINNNNNNNNNIKRSAPIPIPSAPNYRCHGINGQHILIQNDSDFNLLDHGTRDRRSTMGLSNVPEIPLDGDGDGDGDGLEIATGSRPRRLHRDTREMSNISTNLPQHLGLNHLLSPTSRSKNTLRMDNKTPATHISMATCIIHNTPITNDNDDDDEDEDDDITNSTDSTPTDDGAEIDNDTNKLFMQLKEAKYYNAKKNKPKKLKKNGHHRRMSKSSRSSITTLSKAISHKSHDPSMKTMIIKEEDESQCDFDEFANKSNKSAPITPETHDDDDEDDDDDDEEDEEEDDTDDDNKTDVTRYTIMVTHPDGGSIFSGIEGHDDDDDEEEEEEESTEYSFTENTSLTHKSKCDTQQTSIVLGDDDDDEEEEDDNDTNDGSETDSDDEGGNEKNMMSVIYNIQNSVGGL